MNTLLYLLAALFCGALAARAWTGDRREPLRRAFTAVGLLGALSFGAFSLYLVPGLIGLVYLHAAVGALLPAAILWFFEQLFAPPGAQPAPWVRRFLLLSPLVAGAYLVLDVLVYRPAPFASPAQVGVALYVLAGWVACLVRLWAQHRRSVDRVERVRIRYLLVLLAATAAFTAMEQLLRSQARLDDLTRLGAVARSFALQGALPPVGAVFGTLFVYFLFRIALLARLVDLHEVFTRLLVLLVAASVLVGIHAVTVLWTGGLTDFPAQATFQMLLASVLFLGLYDPLRARLEALAGERFNRPGRRLVLALDAVNRGLAKVISLDGLDRELLARLEDSGRVPLVSLYLWDEDRGAFRLALTRGSADHPPMPEITSRVFADCLGSGTRMCERSALARQVAQQRVDHEDAAARLRVMDAMSADLALGITSGDMVLGWLALAAGAWPDGFSHEEVKALQAAVDRAGVIIENMHNVAQLEERQRLAALGTMSAGLAHEIRNPLAGIKGAAQYLQSLGPEADPVETGDFLRVIKDEVDRLNLVVSQFLDYARAVELRPVDVDLREVVGRVLDVVRAEGVPEGVRLTFEPDPDLPPARVDPDRIRQVVLNLVQNALHAVDGEGSVTVRTAPGVLVNPPQRGAPAVEIAVEDDGPGIDEANLEKLFVPFFTTRRNGTGLGLPISRRLVEAHGGELAVRSQPGRGSTFVVRLPARGDLEGRG